MKKRTKKLLTAATFGALFVPLVSVSCGQLKFNQNDDGKIKIATNFVPTGAQAVALQEILRVYNETQKGEKDFMPVSLEFTGNTYPESAKYLENQLRSKDSANLQNLIIGYPNVLATVADYKMEMSFGDNGSNDGYGISRNEFENDFVSINDKIGGLKKGGLYGLPIYKSTVTTALNAPVLSYIFETMKSFGAVVKPEDQAWYDQLITAGKNDRPYIVKTYGQPVESEKPLYENGKYVISKEIFNTGLGMLEFAKKAQQLFSNTRNNPTGPLSIMGIDDISSFLSLLVFSMTAKEKGDFSHHFLKIGANGYVDYKAYADKNSEAYKDLSIIAKELIDVAKTGALYVANPPAYSTTAIRRHLLAFGLSSSAGYSYSYFQSSSRPDTIFITHDENGKPKNVDLTTSSTVAQVNLNETNTNPNFLAQIQASSSKSNIYKFGEDAEKVKSKDIVLGDEDTTKKFEEFLKSAKSQANTAKPMIIANSNDVDAFSKSDNGKKILTSAGIMHLGKTSKNKGIYGILDANKINATEFEGKRYFDFKAFSNNETLQKDELFGIHAPRKWTEDDKMNAVYVQGPLLVGIHANPQEDRATRRFVKWLSSQKTEEAFKYRAPDGKMLYKSKSGDNTFTEDVNQAKKDTPFNYIFAETSYLVPYKGVFDKVPTASNPFLQNAIAEFKKAVDNKDNTWSLVEEPVDSLTTAFKNAFIAAWRLPFTQILNGNSKSVTGSYAKDIEPRIKAAFGTTE